MAEVLIFDAQKVSKRFGSVPAVDRVSLSLSRGTILGLVGPNGAGKTTFLKCAMELVHPDEGSITVGGIDCRMNPVESRRKIGYMPGDCNLYLGMKGESFLDFCLAGYPEIDLVLLGELRERFDLPLGKRIRTYSTGMKKKLLLMQALAPSVPMLILDEPTDSLDPTTRLYLLSLLGKLATSGRTILFSSHQLDEVEQVCHRIAFLSRGRLLDVDSAEAIRDKAAKIVRATFRKDMTPESLRFEGVKSVHARNGLYIIELEGEPASVIRRLSELPLVSLEYNNFRLSELYADLYGVDL